MVPSPDVIIPPSPEWISPFPADISRNKLALNVPNNIPRDLPFWSLVSFTIASVTPLY